MSKTDPLDRRARRSRQLLFDALMALILEKGYEQISITEIAQRADVARGTFYLHFRSKDDLLLSGFDALAERILEKVKHFSKTDLLQGAAHPALAIFDYVAQDPAVFQIILNGQGGALMLQRFRSYASETAHEVLESMNVSPRVPPKVLADFVAGAMLSVLTGWLESGMKTPPKEMAEQFYQLIRPSILSALALEKRTFGV